MKSKFKIVAVIFGFLSMGLIQTSFADEGVDLADLKELLTLALPQDAALGEGLQTEISKKEIEALVPWAKSTRESVREALKFVDDNEVNPRRQVEKLMAIYQDVVKGSSPQASEMLFRYIINRSLKLIEVDANLTGANAFGGDWSRRAEFLKEMGKQSLVFLEDELKWMSGLNENTVLKTRNLSGFGVKSFTLLLAYSKQIINAHAQAKALWLAMAWLRQDLYDPEQKEHTQKFAREIISLSAILKTVGNPDAWDKDLSDEEYLGHFRALYAVALQVKEKIITVSRLVQEAEVKAAEVKAAEVKAAAVKAAEVKAAEVKAAEVKAAELKAETFVMHAEPAAKENEKISVKQGRFKNKKTRQVVTLHAEPPKATRDPYAVGEKVRLGVLEMTITQVFEDGGLILKDANGKTKNVYQKEVSVRQACAASNRSLCEGQAVSYFIPFIGKREARIENVWNDGTLDVVYVRFDGSTAAESWKTDSFSWEKFNLARKEDADSRNILGMQFVKFKPGTFLMGSPANEEGRYADEAQHSVTISYEFAIQTTEVTQEQWFSVMRTNPSGNKVQQNCPKDFITYVNGVSLCPQHPVENVSYIQIVQFIQALNAKPEISADSYVYRLPTEAEWEFAARGGVKGNANYAVYGDGTKDGSEFSWAQESGGANQTHAVAGKSAAWGLYDMNGNVWEYVQDFYESFTTHPATNPTGPASSRSGRVVRGGCNIHKLNLTRNAMRSAAQDTAFAEGGFRLVRTRK